MSATRRKLGAGKVLQDVTNLKVDDDTEDEIQSVASKITTGSARRRSSFGLSCRSSPFNPVEQLRITEMYKTVIQMSAENKLNEKNSWNYDLIDHMGKLIKDENRGVNFQKASCTIDASVKIYSNRVDDTYASSHRILESLSRNGQNMSKDENDESEVKNGEEGHTKKLRSKAASNRMNVATTLEKNTSALNATRLENEYFVDPMFQKMSKAFDEGGAKGMLMNNIRLSSESCALNFSSKDPIDADQDKPQPRSTPPSSLIDISELVIKSGVELDELASLGICPVLDYYRSILRMDQLSDGNESILAAAEAVEKSSLRAVPSAAPAAASISYIAHENAGISSTLVLEMREGGDRKEGMEEGVEPSWHNDFDGCDNDDNDNDVDCEVPFNDAEMGCADVAAPEPSSIPSAASSASCTVGESQQLTATFKEVSLAANQDYAFHAMETFTKENEWAGAAHWKYGRRKMSENIKRTTSVDETNPSNPADALATVTTAKSKQARSKRKKESTSTSNRLVFTLNVVDEDVFETVADVVSRSSTAQRERVAKTNETALLLPADAMLQVKDLCRLFLAPNLLVSPPAHVLKDTGLVLAGGSALQLLPGHADLISSEEKERVWGQTMIGSSFAANMATSTVPGYADELYGSGSHDYDDDDGGADDYPPVQFDGVEASVEELAQGLDGLAINPVTLLQANRVVEKMNIGYSKVSKRVNIQKLKADIWQNIQGKLATGDMRDDEEGREGMQGQDMSFQGLIQDLAVNPRQKDVTVSFYFICLLHLANEHTLRLDDQEDLSDLRILTETKL